MKPLLYCPYCQLEFETESYDGKTSYRCRERSPDHTFLQSVFEDTNEVYKIVSRVDPGEDRYYLQLNFIENNSKIWRGRFDWQDYKKVIINKIIDIDFTIGQEEVKKKLKFLLTFS